MIRRVQLNLNNSTKYKKDKLDAFFEEYKRVVNCFIEIFWEERIFPKKVNSSIYTRVDSWLAGKAMKCAGNQAINIVKTLLKINRKKIYKKYQRVYAKCKGKNRNINNILSCRYSEWSLGRLLKDTVRKPEYKSDVIKLNSDLVKIQDSKKSKEFEMWIRVGSVFGSRYSLLLPTKRHKHFNKFNSFKLKTSVDLIKNSSGYYANVYFENKKEEQRQDKKLKVLGIDVGINKLLSLSDGRFLGKEMNRLLLKLHNRVWGSRNFKQTRDEIKHYIGYCVNRISIKDYDVIVMEDLRNICKNTKGKVSKSLRKKLGNWNIRLLYERIKNKVESNRVWLNLVDSSYTSQKCSGCQVIDKSSRVGEIYKCKHCSLEIDSDYNASLNIRNRFLDKEFAVPYEHKRIVS